MVGRLHPRTFYRDTDGNLVVYEDWLELKKEFRRKGFSNALVSQLLPYYQRSGVDRVALLAWSEDGGLVWALRGLSWDLNPGRLRESLESCQEVGSRTLKAGRDPRPGPSWTSTWRDCIRTTRVFRNPLS